MSVTISSASVSSETTAAIINAKDIQIQCPQTAEQKDTESNENEVSYGDYNPNDDTEPESEDISSDQQSENETNEEAIDEFDEEAIVNSKEFEEELADAMQNEAEAEEEEVEVMETEFAEALENVTKLGEFHQETFVNKLCNTFVELNGNEATVEELTNAFCRIKENFALEASEQFIERNNGEDDSDSDYAPTNEDFKQIKQDNKYDRNEKTETVFVDGACDDSESESDDDDDEDQESEDKNETELNGTDEIESIDID